MGNAFMLQAANVVETNLALDASARLHAAAGNTLQAQKRKAAFDAAWGGKAATVVSERSRRLAAVLMRSG
jgi:ribonuclease I